MTNKWKIWLSLGVVFAVILSALALYNSGTAYQTMGTSHYTSDIEMVSADVHLEGNELYLDSDDNTSLTADTDDQVDVEIGGADEWTFTADQLDATDGQIVNIGAAGTDFSSDGSLTTAAWVTAGTFLVPAEQTAISVTAASIITPTGTYQPLTSGSAVTTSTSCAVYSGTVPGQLLVLVNENTSDAIIIDDGGNTKLGGDKTLTGGEGDALYLMWDGADWLCIGYNDN